MPGPGWQAGPSHPTAAAGVTAVTAVRQSRGQGGPGLSRGWSDTRAAPALPQRPQPDASWVILLWNLFTVGSLRSTASADIPPSLLPSLPRGCPVGAAPTAMLASLFHPHCDWGAGSPECITGRETGGGGETSGLQAASRATSCPVTSIWTRVGDTCRRGGDGEAGPAGGPGGSSGGHGDNSLKGAWDSREPQSGAGQRQERQPGGGRL